MVGIFFYVGVEIALAAIGIRFFQEQGIGSLETAGILVTVYYLLIMAGRFIGSALMSVIKAEKMLVVLGIFGVALMLVSMFTAGQVAIGAWFSAASPTPSCIRPSSPSASPNWDR